MARSYEHRPSILAKIFEHFDTRNTKLHWKQVYKNLLLVEHMCIHADNDCVRYFKDHVHQIEALKENYRYRDKEGQDKGINVRKRAEIVTDLIRDEDLDEKRRQGQAQKSKYNQCISNVEGHMSSNFRGYGNSEHYSRPSPAYEAPPPQQYPVPQ